MLTTLWKSGETDFAIEREWIRYHLVPRKELTRVTRYGKRAHGIRAGKLRALAVTTAARSEALPDIATVAEFVPNYEASVWAGIGAPKAMPAEIVENQPRDQCRACRSQDEGAPCRPWWLCSPL